MKSYLKKTKQKCLLAHKGKIVIDTVIHIILRVKSSFSEIMTTFITYLKQEIIFFFILNTFIIPRLVWTISTGSRILHLLFYKSTCVWNFLYKVMREKLEFWYILLYAHKITEDWFHNHHDQLIKPFTKKMFKKLYHFLLSKFALKTTAED